MEEFANHSEQVETPIETTESTPETAETQETQETSPEATPATTQEDYFEVKYNKETKKISRNEAPTYIQKGLNYDKVSQRATEYEQHLNKVAQLTGYQNIDDLIKATSEYEQQQKVQQEAQKLGMDPEQYQQYIAPVNEELTTVKQQLEEMKLETYKRQIDSELSELSKNPEFEKYETEMYNMASKYGMTLTEAFEYASLRGLKEQIPTLQQQAQQKVVDQIRSRQGKHVETHDENAVVGLDLSPDELAYAQRLGISPEEYAKYK